MNIYTGIGSRETPPEILQLMTNIAFTLGEKNWTLRSGHAPGADQAFETGARMAKGKMQIFLPWPGFEQAWPDNDHLVVQNPEATKVAAQFHPAWEKCSYGAKKLHTRNVYQVAGEHLDMASDLVICWTPDGLWGGGTGQALRIAAYLEIPIFNLAVNTPEQLLEFLNYGVLP